MNAARSLPILTAVLMLAAAGRLLAESIPEHSGATAVGAIRAAPEVRPRGEERLPDGAELFERYECGRCHSAQGFETRLVGRARSCAGCHAWIASTRHDPVERNRKREQFPLWDRYVERVDTFLAVPDLAASGARLDPDWVARYLRAPYDVRPGLAETMIRTPIDEMEAAALSAWLGSRRPALSGIAARAAGIPSSDDPGAIAEGERLYAEHRCASCHDFGGREAAPGIDAAPDLRHARDRMRPGDLAAFIAEPTAFGGRVTMPDHGLSAPDAARLRDFVLHAPIEPATVAPPPIDLPVLTRTVTWSEVDDAVFGRVCVHCHMDPAREIDGGAGNTGGLGYPGAGVDLSSWEGLLESNVLDPDPESGESRLLTRLRIRHDESAREAAGQSAVEPGGAPGMPLGLPPLSPEEMRLLRSWIAQGAPGPDSHPDIP